MPVDVMAAEDDGALFLEIQRHRIPLSPGEGFRLAEQLIRGATRAIIIDETDRTAVLDTLRNAVHPMAEAG